MKHIGQVIVAGAKDPDLIRHADFVPAPSVEAAVDMAESTHGRSCNLTFIDHLPT